MTVSRTNVSGIAFWFLALALTFTSIRSVSGQSDEGSKAKPDRFMSNARRITFEGKRSGEGYFSADMQQMVFQSERDPSNPFYQIYVLDFESGDLERVSPGHGKTTCAWIHPEGNLVLFASTQDDPEARKKQLDEIAFRESGQTRRYSWDYDPFYEIYAFDRSSKSYQRLTNAKGYDAEGSYSPDGKLIAFASNRAAYAREMSEQEKKMFEQDPAYMMDIYIMNADGSNVKQLTNVPGYDGGPFFSPDGKKICWRRFAENGATAEIMTMNIDGTDQKQITNMRAMSWAPYFHPSGKYLIYTTNIHGFANFELYLVDAEAKSPPVRVTQTDGFDGLASFTSDGNRLTWTSNRSKGEDSQIYLADWDHKAALKALGIDGSLEPGIREAQNSGTDAAKSTAADFDPRDVMRHVDYLCRKELGGRMTGSIGERKATAYVAAYLENLGLVPMGDNGSWFQEFEFVKGVELGSKNRMEIEIKDRQVDIPLELDRNWRPLSFSGNGEFEKREVAFAGYGIVAPKTEEFPAYDSYADLNVENKWVIVFRFVPEDVSPEMRQHFKFYGNLRKKAFYARERGACGMIVVSGPQSKVKNQLETLRNDLSPSGSSIAGLSISDSLAAEFIPNLGEIQKRLDDGKSIESFPVKDFLVAASVEIQPVMATGRNVVGRLLAGDQPGNTALIVGAHIDHLGDGKISGSLARENERGQLHLGADDNASGVAAMLEIAEYMASLKRKNKITLKHDIVFGAWSGEEMGLHGSRHFAKSLKAAGENAKANSLHDFVLSLDDDGNILLNGESTKLSELESSLEFIAKSAPDFVIEVAGQLPEKNPIADLLKRKQIKNIKFREASSSRPILAAFNMDMVGRMKDKVVLQGLASSPFWKSAIEQKNAVVGLPVTPNDDTNLPTDATAFYEVGIPILSAFTGSHTDYHTPRDTPEKLNYPAAAKIAKLMGLIVRSMATKDAVPTFTRQAQKPKQEMRGGLRAYLGTVPSYGDDVKGVKLSDATKGGPAEVAGVVGGDIIVELAGRKIENIYDYTAVIDGLKVGEEIKMVVERDGKRIELKITPGSRQ